MRFNDYHKKGNFITNKKCQIWYIGWVIVCVMEYVDYLVMHERELVKIYSVRDRGVRCLVHCQSSCTISKW